jgi:hypothetical protein
MFMANVQFVWDVGVATTSQNVCARAASAWEARGEERDTTHSSQLVSWADAVDADVATSSATAANADVVAIIVFSLPLHAQIAEWAMRATCAQ